MDLSEKIVECVPNFSEGCDSTIIDSIANAISQTKGCVLVDVDAGTSTNRTVYTFFGSPESVVNGALNGALKASELIDMKNHVGRIFLYICLKEVYMPHPQPTPNPSGESLRTRLVVGGPVGQASVRVVGSTGDASSHASCAGNEQNLPQNTKYY